MISHVGVVFTGQSEEELKGSAGLKRCTRRIAATEEI